jgi:hypothetical protein
VKQGYLSLIFVESADSHDVSMSSGSVTDQHIDGFVLSFRWTPNSTGPMHKFETSGLFE